MESISLIDGLILTVVSMVLVFIVLGAIGFLIDVTAKIVNRNEVAEVPTTLAVSTDPLPANEEYQFAAEMMALVLASEDEPNRKFEVVESKRIK